MSFWQLVGTCGILRPVLWFVVRKLYLVGADLVNHPTCLLSCWDQIPSGTCLVPLQTGGHNPLMDTVIPLVLCVCVPENAEASRVCFCHPVQMPWFCPLPLSLYLLYLVSLIQATSWSWAGLISFTTREELVCGQTAHYGDDPAALQVTN